MVQRMVLAAIVFAVIVSQSLVSSALAKPPAPPLRDRLDRLVLDYYPSDKEPGAAVLVMVDDKPVLRKGYGMADLEKGVKVKPDTIFRITSVTKQFTSVDILQLVQKGKVSLDAPITKYLPDLDTRGKTITVEHLLSHSAGLPNYTATPGYLDGLTRDLKPTELVELVAGRPLEFEPGTIRPASPTLTRLAQDAAINALRLMSVRVLS